MQATEREDRLEPRPTTSAYEQQEEKAKAIARQECSAPAPQRLVCSSAGHGNHAFFDDAIANSLRSYSPDGTSAVLKLELDDSPLSRIAGVHR